MINLAERELGDSWPLYLDAFGLIDDRQRRFSLWALAIEAEATREYRLAERIPGLFTLMFGADPDSGSLLVWALVSRLALETGISEGPGSMRIIDDLGEPVEIPVVPAPFLLTPHRQVELLYATLTCWVQPYGGGSGILTARHASGSGVVHLDDGSSQPVLWYAPECLDAVVAEGPSEPPLQEIQSWPATKWQCVDAITKRGRQARVVSELGQAFGTTTAAIPHYFLIDRPLNPGDSGSLIRLREGGPGVGLYIGALKTPLGPRGLCQSLHQLDRLFRRHRYTDGFYEEEGECP